MGGYGDGEGVGTETLEGVGVEDPGTLEGDNDQKGVATFCRVEMEV